MKAAASTTAIAAMVPEGTGSRMCIMTSSKALPHQEANNAVGAASLSTTLPAQSKVYKDDGTEAEAVRGGVSAALSP